MNDNSLSPNNIPGTGNPPAPEQFPTDALSDYPDYPFTGSPSQAGTEPKDIPSFASVRESAPNAPVSGEMELPDSPIAESIPLSPNPAAPTEPAPVSTPGTDFPMAPNTNAGASLGTEPGTNPGANLGTNSGINLGTNPSANPGVNPGANPGTNPGANPRAPYYGYPQSSRPEQRPSTPPGHIPLQRGYVYPPSQGSAPQQGSPYGSNGYPHQNTGYSGAPSGYNTPGQGYPYGNTGYSSDYNGYNGYGGVPPTPTGPTGTGTPGKPPKKKSGHWMLALLIVGCILIGTVSGVLIANLTDRSDNTVIATENDPEASEANRSTDSDRSPVTQPTESIPRETQPLATSSGDQKTLNQIYTENVPAIVGIATQSPSASGSGSGFIISSDGEILTNYHVVENATKITVSLYDGRDFPATLVGYEAESDIALIRIEAENLPVCAIGNSDNIYVGEQIAAIGNPMGELTYTMTVGYVSAVDRFVNTDGTPISMIQVDAAINPGNSGGPVFNLYGEVVGIATAKYSGTLSGGATLEGLGFAIPINDIVEILNDLRINGKVPDRAYMGVMVSMLPLDQETYGIDHGVFVQSVDEGGSAYKAGVQANDIILKIGDVELNAYENLQQTLRKYRAGDETTITVYRNGETITLPIVFDAKPETTEAVPSTDPQYTEPVDPTEPGETENPWEEFPWDEFPWGDFPWGESGG